MERHETVVLNLDESIVIIDRRAVERVSYHLSPVLPSRVGIMIIVLVLAAKVVGDQWCMVVVNGTTLIFRVDKLHDNVTQPGTVFQIQLSTEHPVTQIVEEIAALLFLLPVLPLTITVVVHKEHCRMIFKETIHIE